ncbi:MAG: Gfo/Idh/MocA family oxidoreductase, partial [Bryobacterales bacterium]|nr:Gfo/Idh/MocA family oxidoreductase [Bryobacterales bacterium]
TGHRPDTVEDIRKLLERKDIDAISVATPDYWHALMTIWGCQAGKDVYVEKPVSFTIVEGRRMVEAARKYNRIVQVGLNHRSEPEVRAAIHMLRNGAIGNLYRGRIELVKARASIGKMQESSVPDGVNWDLYLGPTPMKPFKVNEFHYGWHFFWDTSTTDVGNNAVHHFDINRLARNINEHPVKVHCAGGFYARDSDQQVPNFQAGIFEYADGRITDFEDINLFSPDPRGANVFYGDLGWAAWGDNWKIMRGKFAFRNTPDVTPAGVDERMTKAGFPDTTYESVPIPKLDEPEITHFANFIDCVRSRKREDLRCDVEEGHLSTTHAHLANISFRLGRSLNFDPKTEKFVNDKEADKLLTREYRKPYVLPDRV